MLLEMLGEDQLLRLERYFEIKADLGDDSSGNHLGYADIVALLTQG